ncbi:pol, partial [Symbiodinium sp. CCMP2456]
VSRASPSRPVRLAAGSSSPGRGFSSSSWSWRVLFYRGLVRGAIRDSVMPPKTNKAPLVDLGKTDLPGEVPVPEDDDLALNISPTRKRDGESTPGGRAPKKLQSGPISVDIDRLRALLNEQSEEIVARQQQQLEAAMREHEAKTDQRVGLVEASVAEITGQHAALETKVESLEKALQELTVLVKQQPTGLGRRLPADDDERRRGTLVLGGWPRDTRRADILKEVQDSIKRLGLQKDHDEEAFTTGPRRSVALLPMPRRTGETDQERRSRMYRFVTSFSTAQVLSKFGGKLWCNFSKSQEERKIASHAAWIKRVVASVDPGMVEDKLDFEYKTGTTWGPDGMLASCTLPVPPKHDLRFVWRDTTEAFKPWVDLGLLGSLLGKTSEQVQAALEEQRVEGMLDFATSMLENGEMADKGRLGKGAKHHFKPRTWWRYKSCLGRRDPVVCQVDANAPLGWTPFESVVLPVGKDGKANEILGQLEAKGFRLLVPPKEQFEVPTSRPRQEGRVGHIIDYMCSARVQHGLFRVHVDSHLVLGTDHELLQGDFALPVQRVHRRHPTRPRVWTGGVDQIDHVDQQVLVELAAKCTVPLRGEGYRDPEEVKTAIARSWRVGCKDTNRTGWEHGFAASQLEDPHKVVHDHLQQVYKGAKVMGNEGPFQGDTKAFTEEEFDLALGQMKGGKSVGIDGTSKELFVGLVSVPGGKQHVLEFFNRVLVTHDVPQDWNIPLMVLLPKIAAPKLAKDLRPISMGSAASKLFSRLLLNRTLQHITARTHSQCAGTGRQASDYMFTIWRVLELEREWHAGLCLIKLDVAKAFDNVDREKLLERLKERMGDGSEFRCWRALLQESPALLQSPWGSSQVMMSQGIKQGGVESPGFFAMLAEICLQETASRFRWHEDPDVFEGFPYHDVLFMDDGILWAKGADRVEQRIRQLMVLLGEYGLKLNGSKCQFLCSPHWKGRKSIVIAGETVSAGQSVEVMGIPMRVGMTPCELVGPLLSRARAKFWTLKHIFRSKTGLKGRLQTMSTVLGGTALWCVSALPPDRSAMGLMNTAQLQLTIWAMRLGKRHDEVEHHVVEAVVAVFRTQNKDPQVVGTGAGPWKSLRDRSGGLLRKTEGPGEAGNRGVFGSVMVCALFVGVKEASAADPAPSDDQPHHGHGRRFVRPLVDPNYMIQDFDQGDEVVWMQRRGKQQGTPDEPDGDRRRRTSAWRTGVAARWHELGDARARARAYRQLFAVIVQEHGLAPLLFAEQVMQPVWEMAVPSWPQHTRDSQGVDMWVETTAAEIMRLYALQQPRPTSAQSASSDAHPAAGVGDLPPAPHWEFVLPPDFGVDPGAPVVGVAPGPAATPDDAMSPHSEDEDGTDSATAEEEPAGEADASAGAALGEDQGVDEVASTAETVLVPSATTGCPVQRPGQRAAPSSAGGDQGGVPLEFDDFQRLFDRWREGSISNDEVAEQFGRHTLDLLQTQLVAIETDGDSVGVIQGWKATTETILDALVDTGRSETEDGGCGKTEGAETGGEAVQGDGNGFDEEEYDESAVIMAE